jgi:hypothetical protein
MRANGADCMQSVRVRVSEWLRIIFLMTMLKAIVHNENKGLD